MLIVPKKSNNASKKVFDDYKDVKKFAEKSLRKVWDNREDEEWELYLKK